MDSKTPFFKKPLCCKDHTVTQETFQVIYDADWDMMRTSPQPPLADLPAYYQSEAYISHTDSTTSVIDKVYQLVKHYTLKQKVHLITKLNQGVGSILDIGAGTGDFLVNAKKQKWQPFGIEPNSKARQLSNQKDLKICVELAELPQKKFDVITMWHVLEHVPDFELQLKQLTEMLLPEGHLVIAVPNFKSFDAQLYKEYWAGFDVPRHFWHFSKRSIEKLANQNNLEVVTIKPMLFDAYYVSLLSEKYKTKNANYMRALWNGLRSNLSGWNTKEYSSHTYILKRKM